MKASPVDRLSPLVWAYVGDAVCEVYVRAHLATHAPQPVGRLHRQAVARVRAEGQSQALARLEAALSADEAAIVRRGRNAKGPLPRPRKASPPVPGAGDPPSPAPGRGVVAAYRRSTGFEALLGYLYLRGENQRLNELLAIAFPLE